MKISSEEKRRTWKIKVSKSLMVLVWIIIILWPFDKGIKNKLNGCKIRKRMPHMISRTSTHIDVSSKEISWRVKEKIVVAAWCESSKIEETYNCAISKERSCWYWTSINWKKIVNCGSVIHKDDIICNRLSFLLNLNPIRWS